MRYDQICVYNDYVKLEKINVVLCYDMLECATFSSVSYEIWAERMVYVMKRCESGFLSHSNVYTVYIAPKPSIFAAMH